MQIEVGEYAALTARRRAWVSMLLRFSTHKIRSNGFAVQVLSLNRFFVTCLSGIRFLLTASNGYKGRMQKHRKSAALGFFIFIFNSLLYTK